jgi:hypothetical protein
MKIFPQQSPKKQKNPGIFADTGYFLRKSFLPKRSCRQTASIDTVWRWITK